MAREGRSAYGSASEHVEDRLGRSVDLDRHRPERTQSTPETEVDRDRPGDQAQIDPATGEGAPERDSGHPL